MKESTIVIVPHLSTRSQPYWAQNRNVRNPQIVRCFTNMAAWSHGGVHLSFAITEKLELLPRILYSTLRVRVDDSSYSLVSTLFVKML